MPRHIGKRREGNKNPNTEERRGRECKTTGIGKGSGRYHKDVKEKNAGTARKWR